MRSNVVYFCIATLTAILAPHPARADCANAKECYAQALAEMQKARAELEAARADFNSAAKEHAERMKELRLEADRLKANDYAPVVQAAMTFLNGRWCAPDNRSFTWTVVRPNVLRHDDAQEHLYFFTPNEFMVAPTGRYHGIATRFRKISDTEVRVFEEFLPEAGKYVPREATYKKC